MFELQRWAGARRRAVMPRGGQRARARRRARLALLAAVLCHGGLALADAPGGEARSEGAATQFERGIAALRAGSFELACPSLEQSQALEPTPGTLLALADCLERWQKLASASARYLEFVAAVSHASDAESAFRGDQLAFARAAIARLDSQIPRLRLESRALLPDDARVLLDGQPLSLEDPDEELTLDPGRHVLETQAVGHEPWQLELELRPGARFSVALELGPALRAPISSLPEPRARSPLPSGASPARAPEAEAEARGSAWRSVGWSLGGLGVVGVGVGAVAGAMLLETCPGLDCAGHEARGKRLALITDVGLGVGVAALISSVIVLVNTAPAAPAGDVAARWRPLVEVRAGGGWLGMSHPF